MGLTVVNGALSFWISVEVYFLEMPLHLSLPIYDSIDERLLKFSEFINFKADLQQQKQ